MAGPDNRNQPLSLPSFEDSRRLDGTVIGVPRNFYFDNLVPAVDEAMRAAFGVLEDLGAELREVETPDVELANSLHRLILLAEASSVHQDRIDKDREQVGEDVRLLLDQGRFVLATDYLQAQRARRKFRREYESVLSEVDALVAPAIPIPTARVGELEIEVDGQLENVRLATTRNIRALNLTGLPVLSVPCGFHRDGMPIGLQIVGPRYGEDRILAIGHGYECATDWHEHLPPMLLGSPTGTVPGGP